MQRPAYSMPPAHSPPLHHPVPQHVSTVPQLRSPPPPTSQSGYGYGQQSPPNSQQSAGSAGFGHPAFGGFMDDSTTRMAMGIGSQFIGQGQQMIDQNIRTYVNVSALKHYFNVSNAYVVNKLWLVLFPWRHRPWSRQIANNGGADGHNTSAASFLPPREDINSPDMYIPIMAFTTYVLLSTLIAGLSGNFRPELLGGTLGNALFVVIFELLILWGGRYFLNIKSESQTYDLIAYSGYKFVGVIVTIAVAAIVNGGKSTGGWTGWITFAYTFMANAFFLLRSVKYVLLPSENPAGNPGMHTVAKSQRSARMYFLFFYTYLVQFVLMLWLSTLNLSSLKVSRKG